MDVTPVERLISLLTPTNCHLCGNEAVMLCESCREIILPETTSRCYICNKLTSQNQVCISCRSSSRLRRVWWLGNYTKTPKELIRDMKFKRRRFHAREFGTYLAETLPYLVDDTLVVPIPTASSRIRRRGFDQAKVIAQTFASQRHLKLAPVLLRVSQVDQIGKRRNERKAQMAGSLRINNAELVRSKSILLIDDVVTTGATLEVAAELLRKHGAKHVDAAVVARHLLG